MLPSAMMAIVALVASAKSSVADLDKQRRRRASAIIAASDRIEATSSVKSVQKALADYDDDFIECRDLRHPWQVVGYFRNGGMVSRRLQCQRCPTVRIDVWSRSGQRVDSHYVYPPGYQIHGTGGHVSPEMIRKEVMKRVDIFGNKEEMLTVATGGRKRANGSR